jgi:hypothetical protein
VLSAPKQLIATSVLNTNTPNLPIVSLPKSKATVFVEATVSGLRTMKYDIFADRKRTRTIVIEECKARGKSRCVSFISPATNYPHLARLAMKGDLRVLVLTQHASHPSNAHRPEYKAIA